MSRHENDSVPRRTIRFFADWGADSPLWENGTDNYLMYPEDLGLSGELATRLYGWAEFWCSHHQWETGWDAPASEEWSRKEGDELVAWLRREVASFADVSDER